MSSRSKKLFEDALPDAFRLLANAMKAGLSLHQALQVAAQDGPPPVAMEMRAVIDQMKLGASLEESLLMREKKIASADFSLMVQSMILLRQTGGNLAGHFENLARVLRERGRVSSKIHLLTAQGMTQGVVLGLLPPALATALLVLSPEFMAPLWSNPIGWLVLVLIAALDVGGFLWMRKMARVTV